MSERSPDAASWARYWTGSVPMVAALAIFQLAFALLVERRGSFGMSLPLFAGFVVPMMFMLNLRALVVKHDAKAGSAPKSEYVFSQAAGAVLFLGITGWMLWQYW